MIEVQGPDGTVVEFPDNTPPATIKAVMAKQYGAPKASKPAPKRSFVDNVTGFMANVNAQFPLADELAAAGDTAVNLFSGKADVGDIPGAFKDSMAKQRGYESSFDQAHPMAAATGRGIGMAGGAAIPAGNSVNMFAQAPRLANAARGAVTAGITAAGYAAADRGTVQERIGAASKAATNPVVLGLGAAGGALAPAAKSAKAQRPDKLNEQLTRFDEAGVRLPLAATGEGRASVAKAMAENPIAGIRARKNLQGTLDDTAAAASGIAGKYGEAKSRAAAGEQVQDGIAAFDKKFSERASIIYDKVFGDIEAGQAAAVAAAQRQGAMGPAGGVRATPPVVRPEATMAALGSIDSRVSAQPLADIIDDPRIGGIARALQEGKSEIRFGDLRALRTWVREAQKNPQLRQNINQAGLQRLEQSLTADILNNAEALAGPKAARQLRQADTFYRLGSQRINDSLQAFVGKGAAKSGESAYDMVTRAAGEKGGADIARLAALKKSLRPDEWGDVSSTVVAGLGKPNASVADVADFSISSFVTRYEGISPAGRDLLFGSGQLRKELDNLASVASDLKGVERATNSSKSAVAVQSLTTAAALANPATAIPALKVMGAMAGTGELMTNPSFVRWLAKNTAAAKAGRQVQWSTLQALAAKDPQIAKAYQQAIGGAPRLAGVAARPQASAPPKPVAAPSDNLFAQP